MTKLATVKASICRVCSMFTCWKVWKVPYHRIWCNLCECYRHHKFMVVDWCLCFVILPIPIANVWFFFIITIIIMIIMGEIGGLNYATFYDYWYVNTFGYLLLLSLFYFEFLSFFFSFVCHIAKYRFFPLKQQVFHYMIS